MIFSARMKLDSTYEAVTNIMFFNEVIVIYALVCILLVSILYSLIKTIEKQRRIRYYCNKIPGPPTVPLIGNLLDFLGTADQIWDILRSSGDDYYPIYRVYSLFWSVINIRHPDDAELLLSSSKHITKSRLYNFLHPWFGTGLLTSKGRKWQHRRKILTPAFHFNVLREFADVFDQEGRRMVEDLQSKNGETTVDLISLTTRYTLNTICETAMGTSLAGTEASKEDFQKTYRKSIHDLGKLLLYRLLRPWLHIDVIFYLTKSGRLHNKCLDIVRGFSKKIIGERYQYHEETQGVHLDEFEKGDSEISTEKFRNTPRRRLAMLDLLIAAMKRGEIDDNGIREEVDTFMFEGHDTTAMGMSFTLLLLAEHSEIQQRVRNEVDEVLKISEGRMGITELHQLTYLERCIKEALRLYPSVPFISRNITEDLQLKKYLLPAGSIAHVHIYDLHRDPNFWPNPLHYDPDRFLPDNIQGRHPFSYIPFSGGPRNCIGQKFAMLELKATISHLLHNFCLETVDHAGEIRMLADLVLRPKHTARVKFIPIVSS